MQAAAGRGVPLAAAPDHVQERLVFAGDDAPIWKRRDFEFDNLGADIRRERLGGCGAGIAAGADVGNLVWRGCSRYRSLLGC